jgi:hypothetical protein
MNHFKVCLPAAPRNIEGKNKSNKFQPINGFLSMDD